MSLLYPEVVFCVPVDSTNPQSGTTLFETHVKTAEEMIHDGARYFRFLLRGVLLLQIKTIRLNSGDDEEEMVFDVANLLNGAMGLDTGGIRMSVQEDHYHILGSVDIKAATIDPVFFDRLLSIKIETVSSEVDPAEPVSILYIKQDAPVNEEVHAANAEDSAIINILKVLDGDLTGKKPIQSTASASKKCGNCLKPKEDNTTLMVCSRCRMAKYCSKECQKGHWSQHKKACSKPVSKQ